MSDTDRDITIGQWLQAVFGMTLVFMALGWAFIAGDQRQYEAQAEERAALEAERIALEHERRSQWADFPNHSKCGWSCINRLPTVGESWEFPE